MSAFCGKYPDCGCVGIGKRCYSDKTFADEGITDTDNINIGVFMQAGTLPGAAGSHVKPPESASIDYVIPRNKPCSCGSGKKYKHCCGRKITVHIGNPPI